jgi:hypothetical protein
MATAGYFYDTFAYEICFYGIYFYRIIFYGIYFYKALKCYSSDCTVVKKYMKIQVCSETTLTGESRFHISPPRGFEPVTLVAGSKQVSPLDQ